MFSFDIISQDCSTSSHRFHAVHSGSNWRVYRHLHVGSFGLHGCLRNLRRGDVFWLYMYPLEYPVPLSRVFATNWGLWGTNRSLTNLYQCIYRSVFWSISKSFTWITIPTVGFQTIQTYVSSLKPENNTWQNDKFLIQPTTRHVLLLCKLKNFPNFSLKGYDKFAFTVSGSEQQAFQRVWLYARSDWESHCNQGPCWKTLMENIKVNFLHEDLGIEVQYVWYILVLLINKYNEHIYILQVYNIHHTLYLPSMCMINFLFVIKSNKCISLML